MAKKLNETTDKRLQRAVLQMMAQGILKEKGEYAFPKLRLYEPTKNRGLKRFSRIYGKAIKAESEGNHEKMGAYGLQLAHLALAINCPTRAQIARNYLPHF